MEGLNVPLMLTQRITVANDSLVYLMPDTTPQELPKSMSDVSNFTCGLHFRVLGAAGELVHDLWSKLT